MSKIIKLDKHLANQIAAGEVVERSVSVVKELVENSIDAGASEIKIEISNGGVKEIIVSDNGEGIGKNDLILVPEKYSTSKIKNLEDLYNVMTFGFRGEAIASISSVSDFQIISKTANNEQSGGHSLEVLDSGEYKLKNYPIECGTKVIVSNLFANVPARLNYLKKERTEYNHCLEFLNQISLSYPNLGFEFISDGKKVFKYRKGEDLKTRIYSIYGNEFSENLLELNFETIGIKVTGFISDPKVSFPNKNRQALFVNKRIIKSPLIYRAIINAYNRFIPHNKFSAYVLNLEVDPTQIDVNVHPRKLEIRFASEQSIFKSVYSCIEGKLTSVSLIESPNISSQYFSQNAPEDRQSQDLGTSFAEPQKNYYTGSGTKFKPYSPYKNVSPNPSQGKISDAMAFTGELLKEPGSFNYGSSINANSSDLSYTSMGKIIGQTFNSYIVVEAEDSVKILDQHALAERVIYEKLINNKYESKTQGLLIGESFNLTPKELDILKENKDVFEAMNFDFEIMSGSIVVLNGVPDFIKKENLKNIFLGILDDIGEENFASSVTLQEVRNKIFAYTACRSAIKFGNKLSIFEMNKLLNDSVLDYSATCPHGRPVVFEINLDELKDKYER